MIILWRMILMGDQWIVSERKGSKRSKTVLSHDRRCQAPPTTSTNKNNQDHLLHPLEQFPSLVDPKTLHKTPTPQPKIASSYLFFFFRPYNDRLFRCPRL
jgi:hypothetical protein